MWQGIFLPESTFNADSLSITGIVNMCAHVKKNGCNINHTSHAIQHPFAQKRCCFHHSVHIQSTLWQTTWQPKRLFSLLTANKQKRYNTNKRNKLQWLLHQFITHFFHDSKFTMPDLFSSTVSVLLQPFLYCLCFITAMYIVPYWIHFRVKVPKSQGFENLNTPFLISH